MLCQAERAELSACWCLNFLIFTFFLADVSEQAHSKEMLITFLPITCLFCYLKMNWIFCLFAHPMCQLFLMCDSCYSCWHWKVWQNVEHVTHVRRPQSSMRLSQVRVPVCYSFLYVLRLSHNPLSCQLTVK